MNLSTSVFLINKNVRAVLADYENASDHGGNPVYKKVMFKTLDPTIQVGDLAVVPTETRHKMTVVKVTDVDVNVDFDNNTHVNWIIQRIDQAPHVQLLKDESTAVETIKRAEFRKRKQSLLDDLLADQDELKSLPLYVNGTATAAPVEAQATGGGTTSGSGGPGTGTNASSSATSGSGGPGRPATDR